MVIVYCCADWALHNSIGAIHIVVCVKNASCSMISMSVRGGLILKEPGRCDGASHYLDNPHSWSVIKEAIEKKGAQQLGIGKSEKYELSDLTHL